MIEPDMKSTRRLLAYLLLNIIVSAVTTFTVLWWWEQNHKDCSTANQPIATLIALVRPGTPTAAPVSSPPQATQPRPAAIPPLGQPVIQIENIFGVGDVDNEVVVISRIGEGDLSLSGWRLLDENGDAFVFPNISLNKGAIQVYTKAGLSDSLAKGFYWGIGKSIWRTGETAKIVDPQGNERAVYRIP